MKLLTAFIALLTGLLLGIAAGLWFAPDRVPLWNAEHFNRTAYITDRHLELNRVYRFGTPYRLVLEGCAFEYLPDGSTLLVVAPPELTECMEG